MRTCETCGAELVRHRKHSRKQWAEKRFCDRWCSAQRLVLPRSCACGCGERPLPQRKYVKGHRPLKLTRGGYRKVWAPRHPLAHKNGSVLEHRKVLYDAGVDVPAGADVHHRNGNKSDNRLENLEVIAKDDHTRLHAPERRSTHCPQGHEFTPQNTAFNPSGWRYCKQCNRERARASYRAKAAA